MHGAFDCYTCSEYHKKQLSTKICDTFCFQVAFLYAALMQPSLLLLCAHVAIDTKKLKKERSRGGAALMTEIICGGWLCSLLPQ